MDESISHFSYMSPLGYQPNTCGYCHSKPKQTSLNFYAHSPRKVQAKHYQELVDRGWRRSGTTYYKPDVRHACCPHYTIRLDAGAFKPAKGQRGAANKFNDYVLGVEYKRKAAHLCPKTRQQKKFRRNNFILGDVIHEVESRNVPRPIDPKTKTPIKPAHTFEVELESDSYSEEKYALFEQYQRIVHKEPPSKISRSSFKSFLCSGIAQTTYLDDGKPRKTGSFHQCYRLDGKLVAIGVLDLLPHCVSSVYLIYDTSLSDFAFGKLSALHEISLAQKEGYGFYYMGFYIHSCVKMRYKGTFMPTFVLDPETYDWNLLDTDVKERMNRRTYVSMSRERRLGMQVDSDNVEDTEKEKQPPEMGASVFDVGMPGVLRKDDVKSVSLGDIKVALGKKVFTLEHLGEWPAEDEDSPLTPIAEFVACVGKELAKEIVIMFG